MPLARKPFAAQTPPPSRTVQGPAGIRMGAAGMSKAEVGVAAAAATEEEEEEEEEEGGPLITARLLETQPTSAFPVVRGEGAAAGEAAAAEATWSCFEEFFEVLRVEGEFFPPLRALLGRPRCRELLPSIRELASSR